jgi:hypothetical protein
MKCNEKNSNNMAPTQKYLMMSRFANAHSLLDATIGLVEFHENTLRRFSTEPCGPAEQIAHDG